MTSRKSKSDWDCPGHLLLQHKSKQTPLCFLKETVYGWLHGPGSGLRSQVGTEKGLNFMEVHGPCERGLDLDWSPPWTCLEKNSDDGLFTVLQDS